MKINLTSLIIGLSFAGYLGIGAEGKTDLKRDVYVESSQTDFALTVKADSSTSKQIVVFQISAPNVGAYSLLCFLDGRIWSQSSTNLPGEFKLNTRGLVP